MLTATKQWFTLPVLISCYCFVCTQANSGSVYWPYSLVRLGFNDLPSYWSSVSTRKTWNIGIPRETHTVFKGLAAIAGSSKKSCHCKTIIFSLVGFQTCATCKKYH